MKLITLDERKTIELEILQAVHDFCCRNDIKYSMACGTLLGAIRHKGFIPWDDDIDIYLPRKDFEKLELLFPDCLNGRYVFASYSRTKNWHVAFGKIYDNRTLVIETKSKTHPTGVSIDIFPVDEVPDGDQEFYNYKSKQLQYLKANAIRCFKFNKQTSFIRNIGALLLKLPYIFLSTERLVKRIDENAKINNGHGYSRLYECAEYPGRQIPFPKSLFDDLIDTEFEGRYFKGFNNYDQYLTNTFGEYMTPPPESQRVSLHVNNAFWI